MPKSIDYQIDAQFTGDGYSVIPVEIVILPETPDILMTDAVAPSGRPEQPAILLVSKTPIIAKSVLVQDPQTQFVWKPTAKQINPYTIGMVLDFQKILQNRPQSFIRICYQNCNTASWLVALKLAPVNNTKQNAKNAICANLDRLNFAITPFKKVNHTSTLTPILTTLQSTTYMTIQSTLQDLFKIQPLQGWSYCLMDSNVVLLIAPLSTLSQYSNQIKIDKQSYKISNLSTFYKYYHQPVRIAGFVFTPSSLLAMLAASILFLAYILVIKFFKH